MEKANAKTTASARRELILRALDGKSVPSLAREYGISRTRVYALLERTRLQPETDLREAEADAEFWRVVALHIKSRLHK